ncbi:ECF transporter S component [bacterium 210917-SL.2.15]|nr:ECF transporter S component [bacterium 210917-SL.2.15]
MNSKHEHVSPVKKLVLSAMFLALGLVLPFFTGQIPEVGSMLLPMHIPVLLCGMIVGGPWGLLVGFICPLLRSALFSMPPPYPAAVSMAFELAAYGLTSGLFYRRLRGKGVAGIYLSLIAAMLLGRVVWGITRWIMMAFGTQFSIALFFAGGFTSAVPGIVLQLILIPIILAALQKAKLIE